MTTHAQWADLVSRLQAGSVVDLFPEEATRLAYARRLEDPTKSAEQIRAELVVEMLPACLDACQAAIARWASLH